MRPVGIAIVGADAAGERLAAASSKLVDGYIDSDDRPRLMTIVDQSGANAADLAGRYQFARWRMHWPIMLEDAEISVVAISEFDEGRMALCAAQAGKHVHLEHHPFDSTSDSSLIKAVKAAGVEVNVSYPHFTSPSIVLFCEMFGTRELGTITQFRASLTATKNLSCVQGLSKHSTCCERNFRSTFLSVLAIARKAIGEIKAISFQTGSDGALGEVILLRFESGLTGTIEVRDCFLGESPSFQLEAQGTDGAVAFNTYEPGSLQFQKRSYGVPIGQPVTIFPSSIHFPSNVHWAFRSPHFTSVELKAIELATFLAPNRTSNQSFANLHDARRLQNLINASLVDKRPHPFGI